MALPVFYTPKMVADSGCFSPSAAKPIKVVESWKKQFDIVLIEPAPATIEEFNRAHDPFFVDEILTCRQNNGFGNKSSEVAVSLPYTSGAMLAAARHVMKTRTAAAAPCSGFHHAGYLTPEGYCTFNGLMVTATALHEEFPVPSRPEGLKVGILDLDMHYGNGTDNIINRLHAHSWVKHFTGGARFNFATQVPDFFANWLPRAVQEMITCDIVLYQAGADPHLLDPYGGWLTTEQLRIRDAYVFTTLAASGTPVAWNLAGGYQVEPDGSIPKVLEIHDNTMRECIRAFGA